MNLSSLASVAALAMLPFAALAAEPSASESMAVLAVGNPPGGPTPELADLTRALQSAVSERTRGVLGAAELRQRMMGQPSAASLTELDRAYAGAVTAYQAGDYEGAARTLRAVIEDLERLPESWDAFAHWTRAMLRLARAEGSVGRKGEAREVMERLLRANPSASADPELYPPSFAKQLDQVRAALKAGPMHRLVVNANGRQARVFLEGQDVGPAPYAASLPIGRYRVSGRIGEARLSGVVVDLTQEDQTVSLDFSVAESARPDAGPGLALGTQERAKGIVAAGAAFKLDRILATTLEADGDIHYLVGTVYDVRRGMLQREGRLRLAGAMPPAGGLPALAGFLVAGESSALVITRPDLSVRPVPRAVSPDEPVVPGGRSRVLGWSSVGTGALALGLAVFATVEGVSASKSYADARGMRNGQSIKPPYTWGQYDNAVSDGDSARNAAWIGGGAAALCAVTSGVLGYLSYKQTGEIGPFRF